MLLPLFAATVFTAAAQLATPTPTPTCMCPAEHGAAGTTTAAAPAGKAPLRRLRYEMDTIGWTETIVKRSGLEGGMSGAGGNDAVTSAQTDHVPGELAVDVLGLTPDGSLLVDMRESHPNRSLPPAEMLIAANGAVQLRKNDTLSGEMAELARFLGRAVFAGRDLLPGEHWTTTATADRLTVDDAWTVKTADGDVVTLAADRRAHGGTAGSTAFREELVYDRTSLVPLAMVFAVDNERSKGIDQQERASSCYSLVLRADSFAKGPLRNDATAACR